MAQLGRALSHFTFRFLHDWQAIRLLDDFFNSPSSATACLRPASSEAGPETASAPRLRRIGLAELRDAEGIEEAGSLN